MAERRRFLAAHAHTDDLILSAGTIARMTGQGHRVDQAILTRMPEERIVEEKEAMDILSMGELYLIGNKNEWEDDSLAPHMQGLLVASLAGVMDRAAQKGEPYTDILTMYRSVTGHEDHKEVSDAAHTACDQDPYAQRYWGVVFTQREHAIFVNQYGPEGYFKEVPKPPIPNFREYRKILLTPRELKLKYRASAVYNTQSFDVQRHQERFQLLAATGGVVELFKFEEKGL